MKQRSLLWIYFSILLAIALGACTLEPVSSNRVNVAIRHPSDGAVLPLANLDVRASAVSYNRTFTVRSIDLYANGESIGTDADLIRRVVNPLPPFVTLGYDGEINWTPTEVGEYILQAIVNLPLAISETVRVCIIDFSIPSPLADTSVGPLGYEGPCPIPDRDASAGPGEQVFTASASPDRLIYRPYDAVCPWPAPITFQADLIDPPQDVAFVVVNVSVVGTARSSHPGETFAYQLILNHISTSPAGIKTFEGSISLSEPRDLLADYLGNDFSEVLWTAQAIGRDGSVIFSLGPSSIPVEPCSPTRLSITLPPETPTATSTPTSDQDCPPGTYFAPATNRCISIQIVTSNPGGGNGGNSCQPPAGGCGQTEYWSSATCSCQVLQ